MFDRIWCVEPTRRAFMDWAGKTLRCGVAMAAFGAVAVGPLASQAATNIEPEEKVAETIKRLFGANKLQDGAALMKLDLPEIAENGSVVPVRLDTTLPTAGAKYVKKVYFIVDNNRRPMAASFMFSPDAGQALIGANLRLGGTTPVRAVVELNDGGLYQVQKEVKVTVGGCGG
jgi:sulfur-oxidizing protein SoxY